MAIRQPARVVERVARLAGFLLLSAGNGPARPRRMSERGQNTVEYLLILATVAGMFLMFVSLFHMRIAGAIFTIIGAVIGANV
ncbi:MAG: hypothetical protein WC421_07815 [Elusimicrobiales bacterium]